MTIKYLCPFWGMSEGTSAAQFIGKVVQAGYDGVEVNVPDDPKFQKELLEEVHKNQLSLVGQQWLQPKAESAVDYIKRMEALLYKRAELEPIFINSHTGRDFFTFEENCKVIDKCQQISETTGIPISHETHRGRFNYAAAITSQFLDKYPDLKLSADFSHWTTVSESLLEDQAESLEKAIGNSFYIHARVGHTQSAQVNDPFAPENGLYLKTFLNWWKRIVKAAEKSGRSEFFICPEFGPLPYMPTLPYTNQPIVNQWDINVKMMKYLRQNL